ncbi:sensor histidine kinase [Phenylobacterium sp.]|uniref:sensor histidine kinase n=1 Tax=Phenylobacterium sp. TaxID=1871053 RepID=UPI002F3EDDC9
MDTRYGQTGAPVAAAKRPLIDRYQVANLVLWVITYILISVRSLGMGTPLPKLIGLGLRRAIVCTAAFGVCILIKHLLLRTRSWPRGRRLALAASLSVAGGAFYTGLNQLVFYVLFPIGTEEPPHSHWEFAFDLAMNFSVLVWSFIVWCAVVFALSYDEEVREQSMRLVQAQALAAESQNQMLRYQINPHFLFNTLNALSSLILQKDFVRAERMVLSLSNFLRASLEKTPGDKITLADELTAQRQYLAIEQERFGDRLRLSEAAPADLRDALLPGLILQPLIENAVKYGVARTTRPVAVEITAQALNGRLRITVQDDAVPDIVKAPTTLGVGLANVRRRLEVLYGEAGALTCGPRPGGGFAATVELPLERR